MAVQPLSQSEGLVVFWWTVDDSSIPSLTFITRFSHNHLKHLFEYLIQIFLQPTHYCEEDILNQKTEFLSIAQNTILFVLFGYLRSCTDLFDT